MPSAVTVCQKAASAPPDQRCLDRDTQHDQRRFAGAAEQQPDLRRDRPALGTPAQDGGGNGGFDRDDTSEGADHQRPLGQQAGGVEAHADGDEEDPQREPLKRADD